MSGPDVIDVLVGKREFPTASSVQAQYLPVEIPSHDYGKSALLRQIICRLSRSVVLRRHFTAPDPVGPRICKMGAILSSNSRICFSPRYPIKVAPGGFLRAVRAGQGWMRADTEHQLA